MGTPTSLSRERETAGTLDHLWVTVDGRRMHALAADAAGSQRPQLVLVHGAAVSSRNMRPTAEAFAKVCRVYAPDLPGHGRSWSPDEVYGVAQLADSLLVWMDGAGIRAPVLLGNSFGCQIIASFGARYPDRLCGAILQAPTTDARARTWPRQLGRWLVNGMREGATQPDVALHDWRDAGLRRTVRTIHDSIHDRIEDKLPHVTVPALVVRGERDPIVPQRWAERVTELLPDAQLLVMPDATHTITYTRPRQLLDLVLPFVERVWTERPRHTP